jgi:hypothetical protein
MIVISKIKIIHIYIYIYAHILWIHKLKYYKHFTKRYCTSSLHIKNSSTEQMGRIFKYFLKTTLILPFYAEELSDCVVNC